jgi:hypothetical protein
VYTISYDYLIELSIKLSYSYAPHPTGSAVGRKDSIPSTGWKATGDDVGLWVSAGLRQSGHVQEQVHCGGAEGVIVGVGDGADVGNDDGREVVGMGVEGVEVGRAVGSNLVGEPVGNATKMV